MKTRIRINCWKLAAILFAILLKSSAFGQTVVSQFDFNTTKANKLKISTVGPSGSSINGTVSSDGNQLYFATGGGTVGVDLAVAYGTTLNVNSMELEFRFRKNEANCYFFERPTMSAYILNNYIYFTYRVSDGAGGFSDVTVSSANPIANHTDFQTYLFSYDATSGMGGIKVNGSVVAVSDGPNGRSLYWTGASGNATIGREMDGGGLSTLFLDWVIIRDGITSPLPVELVSFTASTVAGNVQLRWKTATEANNYGFEIERSIDRVRWTAIGFVEGHGTTNAPQSYTFSDAASPAAAISYRLKQIDRDGTTTLSTIVTVAPDAKAMMLSNYPNPFNPTTNIRFTLPAPSRVTLAVYNEIGQLMTRLYDDAPLDAGAHVVSFDGSKLASGSYFARVSYTGQEKVIRMVLVK